MYFVVLANGRRFYTGLMILGKFKMYFVYILKCSDDTLYVGSTNNLEKRLHAHNNLKSGARYTKIRRPVILQYFEDFPTLTQARKRESEIKGWKREKKLKLIKK